MHAERPDSSPPSPRAPGPGPPARPAEGPSPEAAAPVAVLLDGGAVDVPAALVPQLPVLHAALQLPRDRTGPLRVEGAAAGLRRLLAYQARDPRRPASPAAADDDPTLVAAARFWGCDAVALEVETVEPLRRASAAALATGAVEAAAAARAEAALLMLRATVVAGEPGVGADPTQGEQAPGRVPAFAAAAARRELDAANALAPSAQRDEDFAVALTERSPGDVQAWLALGSVRLTSGRAAAALAAFEEGLRHDNDVEAHRGRVRSLLALGDTTAAQEAVYEALAAGHGDDPSLLRILYGALEASDELEAAAQVSDRLCATSGAAADFRVRGALCERLGDPGAALTAYRAALADPTETADTLLEVLRPAFERLAAAAEARASCEAAVGRAPRRAAAHRALATVCLAQGAAQTAAAAARCAVRLGDTRPGAWRLLGAACLAAGELSAALVALRYIVAQPGADATDWLQLAIAERQGGQPAAAKRALDRALVAPTAAVHLARAKMLYADGEHVAATIAAAAACELDAAAAEAHAVWGLALAALGQFDRAAACLANAQALQPGKVLPLRALAAAQLLGGDAGAALVSLRQAAALDVADPLSWLQLAQQLHAVAAPAAAAAAAQLAEAESLLRAALAAPALPPADIARFQGALCTLMRAAQRPAAAAAAEAAARAARGAPSAAPRGVRGEGSGLRAELTRAMERLDPAAAMSIAALAVEAAAPPGAAPPAGLGDGLLAEGAGATSSGGSPDLRRLREVQAASVLADQPRARAELAAALTAVGSAAQRVADEQLREAVAAAEHAVRLADAEPLAHVALAEACQARGRLVRAASCWARAAALAPDDVALTARRATFLRRQGAALAAQQRIEALAADPTVVGGPPPPVVPRGRASTARREAQTARLWHWLDAVRGALAAAPAGSGGGRGRGPKGAADARTALDALELDAFAAGTRERVADLRAWLQRRGAARR